MKDFTLQSRGTFNWKVNFIYANITKPALIVPRGSTPPKTPIMSKILEPLKFPKISNQILASKLLNMEKYYLRRIKQEILFEKIKCQISKNRVFDVIKYLLSKLKFN